MARAYIVLARNDLTKNALQVLDLKANSSVKNSIYDGAGQTGYADMPVQNDALVLVNNGGVRSTLVPFFGLAAYLLDNVERVGAGVQEIGTAAQLAAIAGNILAKVAAGTDLTLAQINLAINGAGGFTNSDLNGVVANSHSTGKVEEVLRILAGEVYRVPAGVQSGANNGFLAPGGVHTPIGGFVARPNVLQPQRKAGAGKSAFGPVSKAAPVQAGLQDTHFRDIRVIVDKGSLHLSALSGALSKLASATYKFKNSAFTYGAGTAKTISGTALPATGAGRAVSVYAADGTLIV